MKQKNCLQEFFKYTVSNVLGMMGLSCYILADTFFISKGLGANGLTALNLAIPVYSFIHGTSLMLGMGGATRYSILRGERTFSYTVYMTAFFVGMFMLLGLFGADALTTLLGADAVSDAAGKELADNEHKAEKGNEGGRQFCTVAAGAGEDTQMSREGQACAAV